MKRKEREITDPAAIDDIIRGCEVCHLAFAVDNQPYVVPVSFGYHGTYLYLHTAGEGKKIDCIAANPRVCFSMERNVRLVTDDSKACKWTFHFESVVGFGKIEELTDPGDKAHGLNQIMVHYSGREWPFEPHELDSARIWRISVDSVTGKCSR